MKIAIVGSAPSSFYLAPYDDPSWEIWGLNGIQPDMPRWDIGIDLHKKEILSPQYIEWMKQQTNPLYLQELIPGVCSGVKFPKDSLVEQFGNYFTNTVSWAIAFAMTKNPQEIGIYGVDMARDTEYVSQRPSCEYFLGLAAGKGIKVTIPDASELLKCAYLYGYSDASPFFNKVEVRRKEIIGRINGLTEEINKLTGEIEAKNRERLMLFGTKDDLDWIVKNWKMNQ